METHDFQTSPFSGNEQLILSLNVFPEANNLPVSIDFSTDSASGFLFDPGPNPVVGQSWPLDEVIRAGDFTLRAVKASLTSPTELFFEFDPLENLTVYALLFRSVAAWRDRGRTTGKRQNPGRNVF
jgi:hypothetical protein